MRTPLLIVCVVVSSSIAAAAEPAKPKLVPHPQAVANTHPPGDVDVPELVPFVVADPASLPGIVVDETAATLVGQWQYSTHTPPYVGLGYLHDMKAGKGEKSVTFTPTLPHDGRYEVRLAHCYNIRRATTTPVTIHHADGETTVRINQQEIPEHDKLFRTLGTFRFTTGREGWVRVSNDGTEPDKVAIADAVQWLEAKDEAQDEAKDEPSAEVIETRKLAEAGNVDAQYKLAGLYGKKGSGLEKNDVEAVKWFRKAAEQNDRRGQSMMGVMYTNGRGVKIDYDEAMKWFRLAAAQNSAHAQYNLGYMYGVGKGVTKDAAESAKWYLKAAENKDVGSQRIIGSLYEAGRGVPKDLVAAYAWTVVGGGEQNPATKAQLAKIAAQMTPEQLAEGAKQAAEIAAKLARLTTP